MSTKPKEIPQKMTVPALQKKYQRGEKLTMLTAYDYTMAKMIDEAGIDIILIGDSLGNVIQGHTTTLPVTLEDVEYHTTCVARGVTQAHVMADMPFMSYQASYEEAIANAGRLIKAGAQSIKLEGGEEMVDLVWYLNKIGIPVNAHIGLRPQTIHTMGGYKIQGQSKKDADAIVNDAQMFEEAGAFSLLLEGIPMEVAQRITESVHIPTIGIGSGPHCNGQVLVVYDLLGFNPTFKPRFVKNYANFYDQSQKAFSQYIKEVQDGTFPGEEHSVHRDLVEVKGIKRIK